MPVKDGYLRNSFMLELDGARVGVGPEAYEMIIAGYELGATIFGGWGGLAEDYALAQEYGTKNMPGNFYMLSAAQQWQAIVARNAELVRNI